MAIYMWREIEYFNPDIDQFTYRGSYQGYQRAFFSKDGTRFLVDNNYDLVQFTLSAPFDITSTVTEEYRNSSYSYPNLYIPREGNSMYLRTYVNNQVRYVKFSTTNGLIEGAVQEQVGTTIPTYSDYYPKQYIVSGDGLKILLTSATSTNYIFSHNLATAYDLTSYTNTTSVSMYPLVMDCIAFNADGTKLYAVTSGPTLQQFDLSTPRDISTRGSATKTVSLSSYFQSTAVYCISFSSDYSHMLISGTNPGGNYSLTAQFDLNV